MSEPTEKPATCEETPDFEAAEWFARVWAGSFPGPNKSANVKIKGLRNSGRAYLAQAARIEKLEGLIVQQAEAWDGGSLPGVAMNLLGEARAIIAAREKGKP